MIQLHDRKFEVFISHEMILQAVDKVALSINEDYADKNPLFIGVLNGCFMFMADLMKRIHLPSEITFVRLSSYKRTQSTGVVKELLPPQEDTTGRDIIVVEDIIDTGRTLASFIANLEVEHPASIKVATLFMKPDALEVDIPHDYVGMDLPKGFIVGYGLDYDGLGRNLKDIYRVVS